MLGNKTNAMFVAIAALLLIAGTALPVVHAENGETSGSSDVTVDIEQDDPEIEITDWDDNLDPETGTQTVEFEIYSGCEDRAVDGVSVSIASDLGNVGEAVESGNSGEIYDDANWDEGVYTDTYEFELEGNEPFWRYGDWTITAEMDVDEDYDDSDDTDTQGYYVQELLEINRIDNAEATIEAGGTANPEDFHLVGDENLDPMIEITTNAEWELSLNDDFVLADGEGNTIGEDENDWGTTAGTYADTTGMPVDGGEIVIEYTVTTEAGIPPGEYTTDTEGEVEDDGVSVDHTLTNTNFEE